MSSPERFLAELGAIYAASRDSDDGNRCAVAPHPELRARIKEAVSAAKAAGAFPEALSLRAAERKAYGLNDGTILPAEDFPLGTSPSLIRSAAAERAPLRGTLRVIVVLADFDDKAMVQTQDHYRDLFFSTGVLPTKSVREYYREATNGLIDIQGEVIGPLRLPQTIASYAHGSSGMSLALPNAQTMARDALIAADTIINFDPYDNDGNGFVDAFIVVHAGSGAEVTGSSGDIWSHKWVIAGGARAVDHTKVFAYLTVPEDCKIGVCAHELGHLLFGFPDLYDTDGTSEGIGNWCLMAGGSWGAGGDTPAHPSAWCKANQGWVAVDNRTVNATVSMQDVKSGHTVYRLWKDGAPGSEYFLVENRQREGFDVSLPGSGLLIWHIDEGQSGNTDENHYKVALLQADGRRDLERSGNRGDDGDCYPGSSHNATFNATSTPNSKSYADADTCVAVTGISPPGAVMTANLRVTCVVPKPLKEKDKDKDKEKEFKEFRKELRKEFKEKDKEFKELRKEFKDFKEVEKPINDRPGKPVTDKSVGLDKGFDGKLVDGRPLRPGGLGGGGGGLRADSVEARLAALETAVGLPDGSEHSLEGSPFIGRELRPDLSQGAYSAEEDLAQVQEQMRTGSAQAKRIYDSKARG